MTSRSPQVGLFEEQIRDAEKAAGAAGRWMPLFWRSAAALGLVATVAGCIEPEADYNDFVARPVLMPEAGMPDVVLTPCQELLQQNPSGSYFLSCIVKILPTQPFSLAAQVKATASDGGGSLAISFQPLSNTATSLADVVADAVMLPPTPLASDCTFVQPIGNFVLPISANTLNVDVVAKDVVLRGKLQSATNACGDLDGDVTQPPIGIMLAGNGDVCVFIQTPMDAALPALSAPSDFVCDPAQLPPPP